MNLPEIEPLVDSLTATRGTAWIAGPQGSGRALLVAELQNRIPDLITIELLPRSHADATGHLALSLAAMLPSDDQRRALLRVPLKERASALVRAAAAQERRVVLRVDGSWFRARNDQESDRAATAWSSLIALAQLPATWIVDVGSSPETIGCAPERVEHLEPHRVPLTVEGWEDYAQAAAQLAASARSALLASPQVWRLAVGAVALGLSADEVANLVSSGPGRPGGDLLRAVVRLIHRADLTEPARRFAQARGALPRETLVEVVRPPPEHEALFTQCLGYGEPVRVPTRVRAALCAQLRPAPAQLEATHAALARHATDLDGVQDPTRISTSARVAAWFDKVHHLARAGDSGREAWHRQQHPTPETYWDLARYLSIERKRYHAAAEVYAACRRVFPHDDYAAHYMAFNLDRASAKRAEVEPGYRDAVALAPSNPWWNTRLITFLIRRGQHFEADRAWRTALAAIDPDGERLEHDPWLVAHLHGWVIDAWIEADQWLHAKALLSAIPVATLNRARQMRPQLSKFSARIHRAERADHQAFREWCGAAHDRDRRVASQVWRALDSMQGPVVPPPAVHAGTEPGTVGLAWSTPRYAIEIEADEPGDLYWYARDRATDTSEDGDCSISSIPERLALWFRRLQNA